MISKIIWFLFHNGWYDIGINAIFRHKSKLEFGKRVRFRKGCCVGRYNGGDLIVGD